MMKDDLRCRKVMEGGSQVRGYGDSLNISSDLTLSNSMVEI